MINLETLKVGDSVELPIYPEHTCHEGKVVFIHPEKRFFTVEFSLDGGIFIRESFPFHGPMTI